MSNFELPEHVNPYQLADRETNLEGVISGSRLERLADATAGEPSEAHATLRFFRDESNRRVIAGQVNGVAKVQCQRCLNAFGYKLSGEFQLALVYNEEMSKGLPAHLDALLLLPDEAMDVADVIEEELLLCLPIHAKHPAGECRIETQFGEVGEEQETEKTPNPFDVLKDLK
ncbi:YceD family protein [Reinekea marina]|uniref:Large ribosomal RNA subunit accumulation protein YceD n=1 Tax=Reinekea marina TaxID=1310421 RepID=A0ABV7WMN1_9GAMM|nr:YceD family protein [Reinekea marina]MBU2863310.1 DUF177 domain-containing protein [Reinekea forsetii]MDN3649526.1 YceD family protein [Reinekea marina]